MKRSDYDINDFLDDGTLCVSGTLWLVMLYLSRHLLLLVLGAISTFFTSQQGLDASGFSVLYSSPVFLAASLPAAAVVVASLCRRPAAGSLVRGLWRSGRWLLVAAAIIDLALIGWTIATSAPTYPDTVLFTLGVLDAYALLFLLRSARARDTFSAFPARPAPPERAPRAAADPAPDSTVGGDDAATADDAHAPTALPSLDVRVRLKFGPGQRDGDASAQDKT